MAIQTKAFERYGHTVLALGQCNQFS